MPVPRIGDTHHLLQPTKTRQYSASPRLSLAELGAKSKIGLFGKTKPSTYDYVKSIGVSIALLFE